MRPRIEWLAPLLLLAPLAALPGCGRPAEATTKTDEGPKPVPVTVAPLEARTVERTVDAVGTLRGFEEVTVGSKRAGRVVRLLRDMGDRVKPGEPLVELESIDAKLAVDQADSKYLAELVKLGITRKQAEEHFARYGVDEKLIRNEETERLIEQTPSFLQYRVEREKAEQELERQRNLNNRGAGTRQDLQNAENAYRLSEALLSNVRVQSRNVIANALAAAISLAQAKQALADMTVVAPKPTNLPPGDDRPVEYAIGKRHVSEGQIVREGDKIADLVILDPLKLRVDVPERFAREVALGQPVRIHVPAWPDEAFKGEVVRINPTTDPTSRTFQVEATFPNPGGKLHPGGFAKAAIVTQSHAEAAVVPTEAVVQFAGVTKVFFVESDRARAVEVETGVEGPGWVEVRGRELPSRGRVVTTGQSQLAEGTLVQIKADPADRAKETRGE